MKVVVVTATFPPIRSGGSDLAFWLCHHLAAAGLDIEVITSRVDNVATDPAFRVYPIMKSWSWREMPRLLRFLRQSRPDLVNLFFQQEIYRNHPMVTLVPIFLKRMHPTPRVVTNLETPGGMKLHQVPCVVRAVRRLLVRWLNAPGIDYNYGGVLSYSDAIVLGSEAHGRALEADLPGVGAKCVLIPMSSNLRRYPGKVEEAREQGRKILGIPADELVIAFYGYLYPGKGLETLIRAFALLAARRKGIRLLVIGGDNQVSLRATGRPRYVADLQRLAQREGVGNRITWTGYCPPENDRGSLYLYSADLCVLPFDYGVHANNSSFTAAVSHGLPVVTTKGAIVEASFMDGENVMLCQPQNPQALVKAIDRVLDEPELRRKLVAGALTLYEERLSWEATVKQTLEVFRASKS